MKLLSSDMCIAIRIICLYVYKLKFMFYFVVNIKNNGIKGMKTLSLQVIDNCNTNYLRGIMMPMKDFLDFNAVYHKIN